MQTKTIEDAIKTALEVHHDQKDKNGEPYILHPLRVMLAMDSDEERIVAVLHDCIEDGGDVEDLAGFDNVIFNSVWRLTHPDYMPYIEYIRGLEGDSVAIKVKLADLADNLDPRRNVGMDSEKDEERREKYRKAVDMLIQFKEKEKACE